MPVDREALAPGSRSMYDASHRSRSQPQKPGDARDEQNAREGHEHTSGNLHRKCPSEPHPTGQREVAPSRQAVGQAAGERALPCRRARIGAYSKQGQGELPGAIGGGTRS
jgi:hypothetical protein